MPPALPSQGPRCGRSTASCCPYSLYHTHKADPLSVSAIPPPNHTCQLPQGQALWADSCGWVSKAERPAGSRGSQKALPFSLLPVLCKWDLTPTLSASFNLSAPFHSALLESRKISWFQGSKEQIWTPASLLHGGAESSARAWRPSLVSPIVTNCPQGRNTEGNCWRSPQVRILGTPLLSCPATQFTGYYAPTAHSSTEHPCSIAWTRFPLLYLNIKVSSWKQDLNTSQYHIQAGTSPFLGFLTKSRNSSADLCILLFPCNCWGLQCPSRGIQTIRKRRHKGSAFFET